MKTRNSTKSKLLSSVIALVLCVSMLIGATFAWFTDTASTGVNKIQAGNLDIALEMKDTSGNWVNAEGKTLQFKVGGSIPADGTQILWEPGCTYELPELRIVNKGDLALKYKIQITGIQGDAELNRVIDWTINDANLSADHPLAPGAFDTLTIKGHMQESAGNEYQGKSIDGIGITVYATQNTVEFDSINNQYDKDALYPVLAPVLNNTDSIGFASIPATETKIENDKAVSKIPENTEIYENTLGTTRITLAAGGELQRVLKTTNSSADSVTYDIGYNYVNGSSTTEVHKFSNVVENIIQLSTGLKEVKVTHNGTAMTEAPTKADGTYRYDAATGKLYIYSSTYSSYTISYKSEHEVAVDGQGMTLAAFRDSVNAGTTYTGKVVTLVNNVSLADTEWTPIGTQDRPFSGTFDGNGKTITGLTGGSAKNSKIPFALIGYGTGNVTVKNLTMTDVKIDSGEYASAIMGLYIGAAGENTATYAVNFENITVTGSITGTDKPGAILGCTYSSSYTGKNKNITFTFDKCLNNADISGSRVGGIAGAISGQFAEDGNNNEVKIVFKNCVNTGNITETGSTYKSGGIVGWMGSNGNYEFKDCSSTGTADGGLFGRFHYAGGGGSVQPTTNPYEHVGLGNGFGYLDFTPQVLTIYDCYSWSSINVYWKWKYDDGYHANSATYYVGEKMADDDWRLTIDGNHYKAPFNTPINGKEDCTSNTAHFNNDLPTENNWSNKDYKLTNNGNQYTYTKDAPGGE